MFELVIFLLIYAVFGYSVVKVAGMTEKSEAGTKKTKARKASNSKKKTNRKQSTGKKKPTKKKAGTRRSDVKKPAKKRVTN